MNRKNDVALKLVVSVRHTRNVLQMGFCITNFEGHWLIIRHYDLHIRVNTRVL